MSPDLRQWQLLPLRCLVTAAIIWLSLTAIYQSGPPRWISGNLNAETTLTEELLFASVLVIYALLCTRVGYRWFDCLLLLVPLYNFYFMAKIAWRSAVLPRIDWTPREARLTATAEFDRERDAEPAHR